VLDSGANEPILFNSSQYMLVRPSHYVPLSGSGVDGAQPVLSVLPPQDVKIGSLKLPGVAFLSTTTGKDCFAKGFDGALTTGSSGASSSITPIALPSLSPDRTEDDGMRNPQLDARWVG
jgi:hypothetical protein